MTTTSTISVRIIENGWVLEDADGNATFYGRKKELLAELEEMLDDTSPIKEPKKR